jgi:hypothetical protein
MSFKRKIPDDYDEDLGDINGEYQCVTIFGEYEWRESLQSCIDYAEDHRHSEVNFLSIRKVKTGELVRLYHDGMYFENGVKVDDSRYHFTYEEYLQYREKLKKCSKE